MLKVQVWNQYYEDFLYLRQEEKDFMLDCMRISPFDLIWYDKVQKFIDEGVISCVEDVKDVTDDGGTFLPHRCDARC